MNGTKKEKDMGWIIVLASFYNDSPILSAMTSVGGPYESLTSCEAALTAGGLQTTNESLIRTANGRLAKLSGDIALLMCVQIDPKQ